MTDPEVDDWYERYDAASAKQHAASTALHTARTALAEAELQLEQANHQLQQIFREKVDLREGLANEP